MTTANRNVSFAEPIDQLQRAGQLRCQRDFLDHIRKLEQSIHRFPIGIANELFALRTAFRARDKWPFDMNADNLRNGLAQFARRLQNLNNLFHRRGDCGQQERCRPTGGVIITDGSERFL